MAKDVITRFKLETTAYDSKLRDASRNLADYGKTATAAGKEFDKFTKSNADAARALGDISTSSTNTKDKVKELVSAYNEAARAYNTLSKEQQNSEWARGLSESLTKLSQRIREAKQELQDIGNSSGGNVGGLFGGGKLDGMLQVFGGNLMTKAAGMAVGLASEIGDAVKQGIELAKQGEGIRIAFERLGRGDILDGLREATHGTVTDLELMKAAVKFNDFKLPVEELGTMLAFAQQKAKDTGQSVDYMVDSIVTGLGRKSLMILDNLGLSAAQIKERMAETGDMTKAVGDIIREEMAKAGDYMETAADRAAQANVSLQNKMEELGRKFAPIEEASNQLWTSMKIGILNIIGGPLATLINQLTEAGRLKNTLNNINGDGSDGKPTRVQKYLQNLNNSNNKQSLYDRQLEKINRVIMGLDAQSKQKQRLISDSDNEEYANAQKVLKERIDRKMQAWMMIRDEYKKGAKDILTPPKAENPTKGLTDTPTVSGPRNSTTPNLSPSQQAEADVQKALKEYADAIANAQEKVMANMITGDEYDKQVQQGQQRLADAYLKAYNVTGNDQYLEGFKESAERYNEMSDVIKENIDTQKQQQQAARELEQAQKKLAEAQKKMAEAQASGKLSDIHKARTDVAAAEKNFTRLGGTIDDKTMTVTADTSDALKALQGITVKESIPVKFTMENMDAFIGDLKKRIGESEVGSDLYNALTAQLTDATTLANLMQTAVQNGLDTAQFDPQTFWSKIFGENPGDYIKDDIWKQIAEKISKQSGKKVKIDTKTGEVKENGGKDKSFVQVADQIMGGVNQMVGGMEKIGIEIPEGFRSVLNGISGVLDVLQAINILVEGIKAMETVGTFLGVFAHGGIVPHAQNGVNVVPGTHYSGDVTPILANAGEVVLNRSQVGNLASQLSGIERGSAETQPYINGEMIYLGLQAYMRRRGLSEIVTAER